MIVRFVNCLAAKISIKFEYIAEFYELYPFQNVTPMPAPTPLEQLLAVATQARTVSIGLPASESAYERRFAVTPEGAGALVARGFRLRMQAGAGECIHYPDHAYARQGVEVTDRAGAMACDIVLHLPAVTPADARLLRRGAMVLTLLHPARQDAQALRILLGKHVIALALDLVTNEQGRRPFADVLHEIDGRAAIAMASSLLADSVHGKGILLGGVPGVVPCEVMIVGSDIAARAAARSAVGLGAVVRMFDDDVYSLRDAMHELGPAVVASTLHTRVLSSALRTADIVVVTSTQRPFVLDEGQVRDMKRGVICFDISRGETPAFPGLPQIDLAMASPSDTDPSNPLRLCYINAGNAVARSAAMALSDTLLTLLADIITCDGASNALKLKPGLRDAAYTFLGKPVNERIARIVGVRAVDINIFLQFS